MGKELKEKYERVCAIKDRAISLVESQLNGNIESVDAKELGEVVDIAKDMAELMKYAEEAEYYHKITEAMDEASKEDKEHYMDKYLPETQMYYTPMGNYARRRDSRGRYMYTEPMYRVDPDMRDMEHNYNSAPYRDRMYYSSMDNGDNSESSGSGMSGGRSSSGRNYTDMRDMREGRSGVSRRTYMDLKESGADKATRTKELEKYMNELSSDMTEMIDGMDANEKSLLKQKLTTLASKIA